MSDQHEYRVVWQREGLRKAYKLYQTRRAAERWALIVQGRLAEVIPDEDPDDLACCSGRECGCHGVTNAQAWAEQTARVPRLVHGPVVEARAVGSWGAA